jgi:hypothetical protein
MDTVQVLGSAMGLGVLAGIRLYATVFALGLAIRMGWFHPSAEFAHLDVLAQTPVLAISAVAFLVEFFADKIPWLDSLWDSVHTFIRPIGAAVLGATALGALDSNMTFLVALLCGGLAFTGHTSKAATRLAANHSPEPFTNVALSVAEDLMVPAGLWVAFEHPLISIGIVSVFLAVFLWLAPKVFRLLNVSWTALRSLAGKWFGSEAPNTTVMLPDVPGREALERLAFQPLPAAIARKLDGKAVAGVHCAATKSVPGLKNSTGYLCVTPDEVVFVARRMFRLRTYRLPFPRIQSAAATTRGLFLDTLVFTTPDGSIAFDVFKAKRTSAREGFTPAWQAR